MFKRFLILMALVTSLIVVSGIWAAPATSPSPEFKQIAAPPADFAQLSLPNSAEFGVRSRSAMIPVTLAPVGNGQWVWTSKLPVDHGEQVSLIIFAPSSEQWKLTTQLPDGRFAAVTPQTSQFGLEGQTFPGQLYSFGNVSTGQWTVRISATSPKTTQGYLLVASQSKIQLYTHLSSYDLLVGNQVGLVSYVYDASADSGDNAPAALTGLIHEATTTFTAPDGSQTAVSMFDDGLHADGAANDGIFGGQVAATAAGQYTAQVTVHGASADGEFLRTSEHIFPVIVPSLSLNSDKIRATDGGNGRLQFNLTATSTNEALNTVQVSAQVWGKTQNGNLTPVAWVGGMVTPQQTSNGISLPLSLDGRWLSLAGVTNSLELRDVRLQDANNHIVMAQSPHIPLQLVSLPANATTPVESITNDMLMGPRPTHNAPEMAGVLMLIHGYCSGGVWPLSHFTQYAQFQDYNQNRSHNQFAQLIDTFGDQFSSFGAVAHSQGGAASLHLYTYYWSGLDYSAGSRRIQSVGTPYRGTALAGDLALLGQIFGVGCGTNFDLTYDGSALWLSGIPSWARDDVYFFTTSFADVWWRYDYCNILSDLLLSDPDDGVVERWAGQLSGGNNMGHKTGWCHTSGMRDPAQTTDSSRNSNMNTYGNR